MFVNQCDRTLWDFLVCRVEKFTEYYIEFGKKTLQQQLND